MQESVKPIRAHIVYKEHYLIKPPNAEVVTRILPETKTKISSNKNKACGVIILLVFILIL